ncbi:MAG: hypothetical protein OXF01_17005 [Gemmatimonadetes bacterium]|nr:hypothetical protein [Gemmatimonadota bacterium]
MTGGGASGGRAARLQHRVRRSGRLAMLLAATVAVTGCASLRTAPNPFEEGVEERVITIEVENHNFNDATLRAVARAERRLGVVTGNGRQTFTIPWSNVDDLQIRIDILAGDRFLTNRVSVSPGESVFLTIQSPLYRSLLRR